MTVVIEENKKASRTVRLGKVVQFEGSVSCADHESRGI